MTLKEQGLNKKTTLIGIVIIIAVAIITFGLQTIKTANKTETLTGYVGGEKIGFLEDEEVRDILAKKYHIVIDYKKAGSLDMVTADKEGMDFLWPSSQTALEMYQEEVGKPYRSEVIFNTPIVIYTRKMVKDALDKQGITYDKDGASYIDMKALTALIEDGKSWADIGLPDLYGQVEVATTDPTKSNSGNMYAGIIANTIAGGIATENNIDTVIPTVKDVFQKLGYMETSSADIFDQFLKTGVGAKPLVAGYESQLLEFSKEDSESWNQIKDDVVMLYPVPTSWSSHVLISLDENGGKLTDALLDKDLQKIAFEKHGFRTGNSGTADASAFDGIGIATTIKTVAPLPDYKVMDKLIKALSE